jgi:6-hydroxymethylpterin diphosphokinase MptE-like
VGSPLFGAIGSDRFLTPKEVSPTVDPRTAAAWDVYRTHFRCFTGSTLDPQFHRLTHPATRTGDVCIGSDETVVIVGAGPSLAPQTETLRRLRSHIRIVTSPRGAEALLAVGITPDLVLIEHQSALDAHHSARHLGDAGTRVLAECPVVAADWRTPHSLVAGLAPSSLFVPRTLPTWGLWPATAVAMAAQAGASRLALLGIDLGTSADPDPAHAPLRALIELLASLVTATTVDCGTGGAWKQGWPQAALNDVAGTRVCATLELQLRPAPAVTERAHGTGVALAQLAAVIERATQLRSLALRARAAAGAVPVHSLQDGMEEALRWGHDPGVRVLLQECLGIAFLPRFWRIGVDLSLGPALWRPLLLATHELTAQADALTRAIATHRRAGPFGPADRAA